MTSILNHTSVAAPETQPEKWLFMLHGIYGSGRNWGSLARQLISERPDWGVELVDLRLHGGSTEGFAPPHTIEACARDVRKLEESLERTPSAILGHSFGGKVALARAELDPIIPQTWVADSTLRVGEPSGTAWDVVGIVRDLPESFGSRDELADAMVENGYQRGVGQWLAMNLERRGDRFEWGLDWDGVEAMLRDYFDTDSWGVVELPREGTSIHIIKASESNSIDDESAERIRAAGNQSSQVTLHTVDGGHWINVDNPAGVIELLAEYLP